MSRGRAVEGKVQRLLHGQSRSVIVELGGVGDDPRHDGRVRMNAVEGQISTGRQPAVQPFGDVLEQGGFSALRGSNEQTDLGGSEGCGDMVEDMLAAEPLRLAKHRSDHGQGGGGDCLELNQHHLSFAFDRDVLESDVTRALPMPHNRLSQLHELQLCISRLHARAQQLLQASRGIPGLDQHTDVVGRPLIFFFVRTSRNRRRTPLHHQVSDNVHPIFVGSQFHGVGHCWRRPVPQLDCSF
eukprot:767828-Hanusia_phi.AAC.3